MPGLAMADVCDLSVPEASALFGNDGAPWMRSQIAEFVYLDTTNAVIPMALYDQPTATTAHFGLTGPDGPVFADDSGEGPIAVTMDLAPALDWDGVGPRIMALLSAENAAANPAGLFNPCEFENSVAGLGQWTTGDTTVQEVFILSAPETMLNLQIRRAGTSALGRIYLLEGG